MSYLINHYSFLGYLQSSPKALINSHAISSLLIATVLLSAANKIKPSE